MSTRYRAFAGISDLAAKDDRLRQCLLDIGAYYHLLTLHGTLLNCGHILHEPNDSCSILQSVCFRALQTVALSENDILSIIHELSGIFSTSGSDNVSITGLTRAFKLLYMLWLAIEMNVPGFTLGCSLDNIMFQNRLLANLRYKKQDEFW